MANVNSGGSEQQADSTTKQAALDVESLIENGKNSKWIVCRLCSSKILKPDTAELVDKKVKIAPSNDRYFIFNMNSLNIIF